MILAGDVKFDAHLHPILQPIEVDSIKEKRERKMHVGAKISKITFLFHLQVFPFISFFWFATHLCGWEPY